MPIEKMLADNDDLSISSFEMIEADNKLDISTLTEDSFEFINPADSREQEFRANETLPENIELDSTSAVVGGFNKADFKEALNFAKLAYKQEEIHTDEYNTNLKTIGYKSVKDYENDGWKALSFAYNGGVTGLSNGHHAGRIFFKGEKIVLAYQGTDGAIQALTDLNANKVTSKMFEGRAHHGFYRCFRNTWDQVYTEIFNHAETLGLNVQDLDITVTGHSLGGAEAKLAALRLAKRSNVQNIKVATFGDPRVFDYTASEEYNKFLGDKTVRLTQNHYDPVPAVAPGIIGYKHVGYNIHTPVCNWTSGIKPHSLDSYFTGLNNLSEKEFISKNSVSYFGYVTQPLGYVNALFLGTTHKRIGDFFRSVRGSSEANTIETKLEKAAEGRSQAVLQALVAENQNILGSSKMSYLDAAKKGMSEEISQAETTKPAANQNISKPSFVDIVKRGFGFFSR